MEYMINIIIIMNTVAIELTCQKQKTKKLSRSPRKNILFLRSLYSLFSSSSSSYEIYIGKRNNIYYMKLSICPRKLEAKVCVCVYWI